MNNCAGKYRFSPLFGFADQSGHINLFPDGKFVAYIGAGFADEMRGAWKIDSGRLTIQILEDRARESNPIYKKAPRLARFDMSGTYLIENCPIKSRSGDQICVESAEGETVFIADSSVVDNR